MSLYEKIIERRTVRRFKQDKITKDVLKKLVNAGRMAPSAANLQPLEYFIADDDSLKVKIFTNLAWAGYIKPEGDPGEGERPAAYIIILSDRKKNAAPDRDIGASAENITLAALEEGIGCCWIGAFKKKQIDQILGVPENLSAELVLALGYPLEYPVCEDIEKDSSIKYYKDRSRTLHVPKRKLKDIVHINSF
jgi:nitroreductase